MLRIACFCLAIAAVTPLWSQVEPSASGGGSSLDDIQMKTPPPLSGQAYPATVGGESRSNFLSGGISLSGGYNDNIMPSGLAQKVGDANYFVVPTISVDRQTPRQGMLLSYSSGFTLYQKTTELNGVTQTGTADYSFHLSHYAVVYVNDTFNQNNNLYNQPNPLGAGGVSAGTPSPTAVYVYPFQNQLGNSLNGGIEYQYGRNAMIGGGGNYSFVRYSQVTNTSGLDDSNTAGGSGFWSRRLSRGQYIGVLYQYSRITTQPVQTNSHSHTVFGFYTKYITRTVSLSVLGGPQYYFSRDLVSGASAGSWTPAVQGSVGYQKPRTNVAANYSRMVSGAGGLVGVFLSNIGNLEAQQKLTRTWSVSANFSYALFKSVTPVVSSYNQGGHTVSGVASVQHSYHEHLLVGVGYSRFHQSYGNFVTGSQLYPDSNREYASVSYQFSRPIGR